MRGVGQREGGEDGAEGGEHDHEELDSPWGRADVAGPIGNQSTSIVTTSAFYEGRNNILLYTLSIQAEVDTTV